MASRVVSINEKKVISADNLEIGQLARVVESNNLYDDYIVTKIYDERILCVYSPIGTAFHASWNKVNNLKVILLDESEKIELYNE